MDHAITIGEVITFIAITGGSWPPSHPNRVATITSAQFGGMIVANAMQARPLS